MLGAKIVTPESVLIVSARSVLANAPANAVRFEVIAVIETFTGSARTLSIM